jgi:hypothetical protein
MRLIVWLFVISIMPLVSMGQVKKFGSDWKLKVGDNPTWSRLSFDDSRWDTISAGVQWQDRGILHDGIGWYRKRVDIPGGMKESIKKYGLSVWLGAIDDADETFFNGTKIGQTGNMEQNDGNSYFLHRNYDIPDTLIDLQNANILAVRVMNYTGGGGFYTGNFSLENRKPESFFNFEPFLIEEQGNYSVVLNFSQLTNSFSGKAEIRIHASSDHSIIGKKQHRFKLDEPDISNIRIPLGKFPEQDIVVNYTIEFVDYSHQLKGDLHPKSNFFSGFSWLGEKYQYLTKPSEEEKASMGIPSDADFKVNGDTYPCTWADDGEIYTSAGDPDFPWGKQGFGMDFEKISGMPEQLKVSRINLMEGFTGGGGSGQKPSGLIAVDGVMYLAVQNMLGGKPPRWGKRSQHASDVTIFSSADGGKTWHPDRKLVSEPMFPGCLFGGPAFVNCGKNNEGAPDEFIYAVSSDQWDNGHELRLGRVHRDSIQNQSAWEWVSSLSDRENPKWTRNLPASKPVFSLAGSIGSPEMIFIPELKRYLLFTWKLNNDFNALTGTQLLVYESEKPWGSFRFVHRERQWEEERFTPYCPRVPLKWLEISGDTLSGWMMFSGSWTQNHIYYHPNFRKFKLKVKLEN